jgi:hypothetical protein
MSIAVLRDEVEAMFMLAIEAFTVDCGYTLGKHRQ